MANYYTHASFAFSASLEEADRLKQIIDIEFDDPDAAVPAFLVGRFTTIKQLVEHLGIEDSLYLQADFEITKTEVSITDNGENIDIDAVALAIQLACPSSLPVAFSWANTCDKKRYDAFGGGWCVIFPDRIEQGGSQTSIYEHTTPTVEVSIGSALIHAVDWVNPTPRRPLDDDAPDGYLESDRDYVLNNLEWCVQQLDQHFEDNTEEAVEARISAVFYQKGNPLNR